MRSIKLIILLTVAVLPFLSKAQTNPGEGIHFETGLNWQQIQAKAKAEDKYIFVDCFATWCGPCKAMDAEVLPQKEVGDYFNSHFINVRIQMDKTAGDAPTIKSWYANAKKLQDSYNIHAYPTYLFFNPEGIAVHHITGATTAKAFINRAKESLMPEKQYYTVIGHWREHLADSTFLQNAVVMAMNIHDDENVSAITDALVKSLKNPFKKEIIALIAHTVTSGNDSGFKFFINNESKIHEALKGDDFSQDVTSSVIYREDVQPYLKAGNQSELSNIKERIKNKYPQLSVFNAPTDSAFLSFIMNGAIISNDYKYLHILGDAYFASLKNPLIKENIGFITYFTRSSHDAGFRFLLRNHTRVNTIMASDGYADKYLSRIIYAEEVEPLFVNHQPIINYHEILSGLKKKYGLMNASFDVEYKRMFNASIAHRVLATELDKFPDIDIETLNAKLMKNFPGYDIQYNILDYLTGYYAQKQLWTKSENAAYLLLKNYGGTLTNPNLLVQSDIYPHSINSDAWDCIFLHGQNKDATLEAIKWMRVIVDRDSVPFETDTYANLLYKSGNTTEAIKWEQKAIAGMNIKAKSNPSKDNLFDLQDFTANLEKMEAGVPTWLSAGNNGAK